MIKTLYEKFQHWSNNGRVIIISDPHFDDEDCKLMNSDWLDPQAYVDKINAQVHKGDTLVCLGDVGNLDWVRKIKCGYKVLVRGNHDDHGDSYYKRTEINKIFDANDYDSKSTLRNLLVQAYPDHIISISLAFNEYKRYNVTIDTNLFDEVYDGPLFISDKILLSHEPVNGLPFCINIHGHVHNGEFQYLDAFGGEHVNLAADVVNWEPFDLGGSIKLGMLAGIKSIHRLTIDNAIEHSVKPKEDK